MGLPLFPHNANIYIYIYIYIDEEKFFFFSLSLLSVAKNQEGKMWRKKFCLCFPFDGAETRKR